MRSLSRIKVFTTESLAIYDKWIYKLMLIILMMSL